MILQQHYLGCLSQASYFIGDEASGTAAVVDPRRDVGIYLEEADKHGLKIRHVLLTHFHADFVAGHLELRELCGTVLHLGARAQAEYTFEAMRDGGHLEFGQVRLEFLETPGHTPEGVSILVFDLADSSDRPAAVLTGDTLFIGDVGRPDLMASQGITAVELAGQLYDSTREKLLSLPDETILYPGHGAGSSCGKSLSSETVSTIGAQRASNYALQPMSREHFIRLITADHPTPPAYFAYDAELNRRERPVLEEALQAGLKPLSLEEFLRARDAGGQILDARDGEEFAAGHLAGGLQVGLCGRFAEWAGRMLDPGRPILLVTEPGKEAEAATRLGRIGFDSVAGYLDGGAAAFAARPDLLRTVQRLDAAALARELESADPPLVLDVRGPGEREQCSIPASVSVPLPVLRQRAGELPRDRRIVIQCGSGYRSMIAASLLEDLGFTDVRDQEGGMAAWQQTTTLTS